MTKEDLRSEHVRLGGWLTLAVLFLIPLALWFGGAVERAQAAAALLAQRRGEAERLAGVARRYTAFQQQVATIRQQVAEQERSFPDPVQYLEYPARWEAEAAALGVRISRIQQMAAPERLPAQEKEATPLPYLRAEVTLEAEGSRGALLAFATRLATGQAVRLRRLSLQESAIRPGSWVVSLQLTVYIREG